MEYEKIVDETLYLKWCKEEIPVYGSDYYKQVKNNQELFCKKIFDNTELSLEERQILSAYRYDSDSDSLSSSIDYKMINASLRSENLISKNLQIAIDKMSDIITRNKLEYNVILYRGVILSQEDFDKEWKNFIKNSNMESTILFKGFTSTTLDLVNAQTFWNGSRKGIRILLIMRIKQSNHYYYADSFENEVILNKNLSFKLIKNCEDYCNIINQKMKIDYVLELESI